jgi:hypothetical protein
VGLFKVIFDIILDQIKITSKAICKFKRYINDFESKSKMGKLIFKSFGYVVSNKISGNRLHQLHSNDWSIGSRESVASLRSCLGNLDHLYSQLAIKKKKGIGQRATDPRNPG